MRGLNILLLGLVLSLFVTTNAYSADPLFKRGYSHFEYTGYAPLSNKPIKVHCYVPEGDVKTMSVLFAFTGAERTGDGYIGTWRRFADLKKFIVITPEYSKENYNENEYQFGGVSSDKTKYVAVPQKNWTYNTVEALFDYLKSETGNTSKTYNMWGHSAGGQFVHRFLLWMPNARVDRAVAANPSSWTFPLKDGIKDAKGEVFGWPYSILGTKIKSEQLRKFFARTMWVNLGDQDVDLTRKDLSKVPGAQAQGDTRFERGKYFFATSQKVAAEMKAPFNWGLAIVEGVGHAGRSMVYGKSTRDENNKAVFSVDNVSETAGYWLLYGDR